MQKRRLVGASALGILVAVGLSGCMKMDMQLDLQSDDTVDGSMVFAISTAVAELAGESPESIAEQMQADALDLGEGGTTRTEPYDDGEYIGSTTYFEGKSLAEFDDPDSVSIVREGDEFVVSGAFDLTEATEGADAMPGLTDSLDIRIAVSFPGAVSSHNGTLEGNTVVWQAVPGERLELEARGSAVEGGGGSLPLPLPVLIGIGLVVLLLIGLILFLVLRPKRGAAAAPATAYPAGQYATDQYATGQYATGQYPTTPMPSYAPDASAVAAGSVPPPAPPAPPESQVPPAPPAPEAPPAPPAPAPEAPAPPAPPAPPAEPKADQGPPPPPQA